MQNKENRDERGMHHFNFSQIIQHSLSAVLPRAGCNPWVDLRRTPCQGGGYPNSFWWLRLCSAQPDENCQRQGCRDKGKQVSEDVPEHTPTTTWFSAPMLILKTSYKNYISMVWSMRGLNKYLPKELEALLVVPALPLSHRSVFFLEFESFAFVGYLC